MSKRSFVILAAAGLALAGAGSAQASNSAELELDGETYTLDVQVCDFSGEADEGDLQTLVGDAETDDGPMRVFVSRNEVSGMLMHTVSVQIGDVMSPEGEVLEANRSRSGDQWFSAADGPSEPLIRIDGADLTADGLFSDTGMTRDPVEGRLTATCNDPGV
ncbi:hypothetical protein [Thioalkalivibrio sp. HL-Eb18]|jgi:hypothetical protein|uniref:hypothetical protein n=1 Tax=Thioalkalivibrio sp. HL-Eb18 TaxID=1266913 RepID=UPI00036D89A9|nr:hypothetical protein [Thioalkalivibrio sp. HL-Eb18]